VVQRGQRGLVQAPRPREVAQDALELEDARRGGLLQGLRQRRGAVERVQGLQARAPLMIKDAGDQRAAPPPAPPPAQVSTWATPSTLWRGASGSMTPAASVSPSLYPRSNRLLQAWDAP
jgi:hypothetical protein